MLWIYCRIKGKLDVLHILRVRPRSCKQGSTGTGSPLAAVGELAYVQSSKINSQTIRHANAVP